MGIGDGDTMWVTQLGGLDSCRSEALLHATRSSAGKLFGDGVPAV